MIFFFKERMKRNCYLNEKEEHEVESFGIAQKFISNCGKVRILK